MHQSPTEPYQSSQSSQFAILLAGIVLVIEVLLISTSFDAATLRSSGHDVISWLLRHSGFGIQWASVAACAYLVIHLSGTGKAIEFPGNKRSRAAVSGWLIGNIVLFVGFYSVSYLLFERSIASSGQFLVFVLIWAALALGVFCSLLLMIFPLQFWSKVIVEQRTPLIVSAVLATLVTSTSLLSKNLWPSVIEPTFAASKWLLLRLDVGVISIPEKLYLGIDDFVVHVSATCSGVEGMGLATGFTLLYLFLYRNNLRFPRAFILVPAAALLSWVFNVLRITLLILLGRYFSPEFAIGGFHSQAGWFFFIALVLVITFAFHKLPWFKIVNDESSTEFSARNDLPTAILYCFILFLIGAFIIGFDQNAMNLLYPIKVLLGGAALLYFWKTLNIPKPDQWMLAVVMGVVTFFVWIALIPEDAEFNSELIAQFEASSALLLFVWIAFRMVGSVLVAPLIEELFFRSYLLARISSQPIDHERAVPFHLIGFVLSSLAFAAIHQQWLAGGLAGMAYAVVRIRGNLGAAVLAHGVTNGLLCLYALFGDQWAYL